MVEMLDARLGQRIDFAPLAPFTRPEALLADALPILDAVSRLSVTDAAERFVRIQSQGNWEAFDRQVTPYMVEPADMTASRRFRVVAFTGPAQSGKTVFLQTTCLHRVMCDPMPVQIIHMSRPERDKWVEHKLDPIIRNSPAIADVAGKGREDSTFSRKRFRGTVMEIGYPTPQQLSGGTYGLLALTDFDHFPVVLGPKDSPESTPYRMARNRIRNYLSRGCVLVESTPAHPWADPSWHPKPEAPHELPPATAGIVNIVNEGTRGRWYWECPDCGDLYEPRFDRLHYDDTLDPGAAGQQAEMQCPHCGALTAHRHKIELNRRALAGRGGWLHETGLMDEDGRPVVAPIGDGRVRDTDVASYAIDGTVATFVSWSELVANFLAARRKAEVLGDEADLSGVWYTDIGRPYRPRHMEREHEIGLQHLKDHGVDAKRGTAPDWTRFIVVSADVQQTRFPVQVTAFGEDGQMQIVDRFELAAPPEGAPGTEAERALSPAKYAEDWAVLESLATRAWPVRGRDHALRACALAVDFQGEAGVSDNAEAFWIARRKAGDGARWFLSRGHGGFNQSRRVWHEAPERGSRGKRARSVKLLNMAVDRLKDTVFAALAKAEAGAAGALWTPNWMADDQRAELIAEARGAKGWEKRAGMARNETLDLTVQARALAEHKGLLRIDWSAPPPWAVGGLENTYAVLLGEKPAEEKPQPAAAAARIRFLDRG